MEKTYLDILKEHYPSVETKALYDDFCVNEFIASADTKCNDNCAECWATIAHEDEETEFNKDVRLIPEEWSNPLPKNSADASIEASDVQAENTKAEVNLAPDTAEKLNDKGVAALKLSVKSHNAILRAGCLTIGDIISNADKLKEVAPKAYTEAAQALQNIGVHLPDVVEGIITYIEIDKIEPHPNNPRKDVGDVSELAESIKQNGIMQNLTVVPWFSQISGAPADDGKMDGYYIALIGHRRLAAAKLAGLEKVPCIIARGLTINEQIAIMLAENMQRADLTTLEQAEGIQLMFDLGDTVESVSKKTGLSESTVRRRVKLMEYDREAVKESFGRGATLADFEALEKIKDHKTREDLIEQMGTNNFNWALQTAERREKEAEKKAELLEFLSTFAEKVEQVDWSKMQHCNNYYYSGADLKKPKDYDESKKYYYVVSDYCTTLYVKKEQVTENPEEADRKAKLQAAEDDRKNRIAGLNDIWDRMVERRVEFIRNFTVFPAKKVTDILDIVYKVINIFIRDVGCRIDDFDVEDMAELLGLTFPDDDSDEFDIIQLLDDKKISGARRLAAYAYEVLDTKSKPWNYWAKYNLDDDVKALYEFLTLCGYELSDEEQAILDGTHELYIKEGADE